jgi:superfamily I DNA/RNA helicase
MVVCRTNAPVVEMAFHLLRQRRRVKIQGRNFGQDLRRIIEQRARGNQSIVHLKEALELWGQQQVAKLEKIKAINKREKALTQFRDKMHTLRFFVMNGNTTAEVIDLINELFTETPGGARDFVLMGTVHALKGMEAERVWVLGPEQMPHRMAKTPDEIEQEWNLWYVAHTRSKDWMFLTNLPRVESVGRSFEEQ